MKKITMPLKSIIKVNLLLLFSLCSFSAYAEEAITGKWKTIDDKRKEPRSVIEIFENTNGTFSAKVDKVFPKAGEDPNPKCAKCPGDKKDQPIIGMQVLSGLKKESDNKWTGGKILDPDNGKTYSCKIESIENGAKLKVRGFLGISLLGRTQIWEREASH